MKTPKFKIGEIVEQKIRGWKRKIRYISFEEHGYEKTKKVRVVYSYYNEKLDTQYQPTGEFDHFNQGVCTEAHLIAWIKK